MNGWFLTYIILGVLGLGIHLAKHGQSRRDEKYNFWAMLFSFFISVAIVFMAIVTGF